MENSNIAWCNHTLNPWTGCAKVGEECRNCYAEYLARTKPNINVPWGPGQPRKPASEEMWKQPIAWNEKARRAGVHARVFCASLADVFDAEAPAGLRERLFNVIGDTPHLDWLMLTKRAQLIKAQLQEIGALDLMPLPNVWIGVSAGDQVNFDKRWKYLREVPAVVRFCSYEPALGPIILPDDVQGRLDWLICGGETAPKKGEGRIMQPEWARTIRDQCAAMGVRFFFKQFGNWLLLPGGRREWHGKTSAIYARTGHLLDGVEWHQFPQPKQREAAQP